MSGPNLRSPMPRWSRCLTRLNPQHPEITYSVTYKNGPSHKPEGILPPGAAVKVKERMVFNVSRTGQS